MTGLAQNAVRQPEAGCDLGSFCLGRESPRSVEFRVGLGIALHGLVPRGVVVAAHVVLGLAQPAYNVIESASRKDAVASQHLEIAGPRILRQVADAARATDLSPGGQRLTRQDAGHRGLARAVATHQSNLVAWPNPERRIIDEDSGTRTYMQVTSGDHEELSKVTGRPKHRDSGGHVLGYRRRPAIDEALSGPPPGLPIGRTSG